MSRRGGIGEQEARSAIARGAAFLRGRRVRDPDDPVQAGDRVEVDLREPASPELPRLLHLDPLVIAVDNPGGSGVAATRCVLDPPLPPSSYTDLPAACPYLTAATVSDGRHVLYAASEDLAGMFGLELGPENAAPSSTAAPKRAQPARKKTAVKKKGAAQAKRSKATRARPKPRRSGERGQA